VHGLLLLLLLLPLLLLSAVGLLLFACAGVLCFVAHQMSSSLPLSIKLMVMRCSCGGCAAPHAGVHGLLLPLLPLLPLPAVGLLLFACAGVLCFVAHQISSSPPLSRYS
jgi:hypothetical protein